MRCLFLRQIHLFAEAFDLLVVKRHLFKNGNHDGKTLGNNCRLVYIKVDDVDREVYNELLKSCPAVVTFGRVAIDGAQPRESIMPRPNGVGNSTPPPSLERAVFPLADVPGGAAQCLAFIRDFEAVRTLLEEFIASIGDEWQCVSGELMRASGELDEVRNYIENAGMTAFCNGMPAVTRKVVRHG